MKTPIEGINRRKVRHNEKGIPGSDLKGLVHMALEKMDIYYNSVAETYDERVRRATTDEDGYIVRMVSAFPMKENLNIVDIGASTGLQLKPLLEQSETLRATCVDCSGKMLARLKKNLADYSGRVQAVAANFFDHDFGFEFYDGAVAAMALHYYSEAQKLQLYKNLRAGLKKDGFFLLTDKFAPTQNYQDFCRSEFERKRAEAHQPEGHYYTFTPLTVANEAALLFKAGFAEVQVRWAKSNTAVLLATK